MSGAFAGFVTGCIAAFILKLTTSMDDLIWFSPFLTLSKTTAGKYKCGAIYLFISMYVTVAAYAIAQGSEYGLDAILRHFIEDYDGTGYWDSSRILSVIASLFIGSFAVREYIEWREDEDNDFSFCCGGSGDDDNNIENGETKNSENDVDASKEFDNEETPLVTDSKEGDWFNKDLLFDKDSRRLFVVAFCGSLDDTAMFSAVLMGKGLLWSELLIGSIVASTIVFFLCVYISSFKPFADFVSAMPIWTLFAFLSCYILLQGLL